jgi:hypothetical protein
LTAGGFCLLTRNNDIPIRFLRLVLPEEGRGLYCAAIKMQKGLRHIFVETIDELLSVIEEADRDGHTVYHALAVFKDNSSRKQKNAVGAKAFWLDIDAGRKKPYPNWQAAADAVKGLCVANNLPLPVIVISGYGLHVYWPLQTTLDPATWKRYASGLKNLCTKHDLKTDPSPTANIVCVLRTPGTHHRKDGGNRIVTCAPECLDNGPYALDKFAVLLEHAPEERSKASPMPVGPMPAHLLGKARRGLAEQALIGLRQYEPTSAILIAEKCEQVRELRDTKGCIPEPLWYAGLGVLAFCPDGDQLGHEWSRGYEGYTEGETQERLDRARTLTGATTCKHFHDLNPSICERCPHRGNIKSPIALGIQQLSPLSVGANAPAASATRPAIIRWETTRGGAIKPKSYINAAVALKRLDVRFRHDVFHNKKLVEGDVSENAGRELSDAICRALRDEIIRKFGFDPGAENVREAAERACEVSQFDPVLDYLASLHWDGEARIDNWLIRYLGAEDTPLNRAIGRKMLIAAVRRARRPGCKFDYIVVFEGPQGSGKSTVLLILAREENFSDQPLLHIETRGQQEAIEGVWIYELSELVGLRRADVETTKSFLSKTEDKARPAYGRFRRDQRRRCIFVGTTNSDEYLRDSTGNRRFWPVKTRVIDLDALRADRDQLWAEAAVVEAQGEDLVIPEHLFAAAAEQQGQRLIQDGWEVLLADVAGTRINAGTHVEERVATETLFRLLDISGGRMLDGVTKRLKIVMHRMGWNGPKKLKIETPNQAGTKRPLQGYWRTVEDP